MGLHGPVSWYVLRPEDFASKALTAIFMRQASPKMIGALLKATKYLGGEPAPELLDAARRLGRNGKG